MNIPLIVDALSSALNYEGMSCNCSDDGCQGNCTFALLNSALDTIVQCPECLSYNTVPAKPIYAATKCLNCDNIFWKEV